MDILLDNDERAVVEQSRAFLSRTCPPALAREHESNGAYARPLWREMVRLGWIETCLPETIGGLALPLQYQALLFEEAGRHIAPVPLLSVMVPALVLARYGNAAQHRVLDEVRSGRILLCFAIGGEDGEWSVADVGNVRGRVIGDAMVLDGEKRFVDNLTHAQYCLVSFRLQAGGVGLALVDMATKGLTSTDLVPTAKDSQSIMRLTEVHVPLSHVVGEPGGAEDIVRYAMDLASLFTSSLMAGAARRSIELAVKYVNERVAFEQPVGSFQAIQHLCADLLIGVDGVELLSREAAWKLGAGENAEVEVSSAKAFANEYCIKACRSAQQLHGGIGFMMEFDLHLWYRRVVSWSLRYGTTAEHRRRVANHLLSRNEAIRLDGSPAS